MQEHRTAATVSGDGSVTVRGLPFRAGETVEVVVVARPSAFPDAAPRPLRGGVRRYDAPFGPALDSSEWEAEA